MTADGQLLRAHPPRKEKQTVVSLSGGWQGVPVHYEDSNDTFSLKPTLPENEKDPFAWSILQVTEIDRYTRRGNLAYNKKKATGSVMQ